MTNRKLDVAVARLLRLEAESDNTYILCDCRQLCDAKVQGEIEGCKHIVPFYHQHTELAIMALEQICDEQELVAEMYRPASREWTVEISPATQKAEPFTLGIDGNLPLAICKALAELEK